MSPVLEDPLLRQQVIPMSVEMYHALGEMGLIDEKTELLRGFILPKMSKSPRHRIVTQRLLNLLRALVPTGYSIWQEQPITCVDSEPEPDISVVEGSDENFAKSHPRTAEIAVEVSLSTRERDEQKLSIYAEAGVKEYWLVLPDEARIEVWMGPTPQGYTTCRKLSIDEVLMSEVIPGIAFPIRDVLV